MAPSSVLSHLSLFRQRYSSDSGNAAHASHTNTGPKKTHKMTSTSKPSSCSRRPGLVAHIWARLARRRVDAKHPHARPHCHTPCVRVVLAERGRAPVWPPSVRLDHGDHPMSELRGGL